jgi:hypothetical protein
VIAFPRMSLQTRNREFEHPTPALNWFDDTLQQLNFLTALRGRNQIRRTCVEMLQLYREAAAELPHTSGITRYERVVARRTGADPSGASTIMHRAEESFASWPVERAVNFRDVVQYLAMTECIRAYPSAKGLRARVGGIVAELIPADL